MHQQHVAAVPCRMVAACVGLSCSHRFASNTHQQASTKRNLHHHILLRIAKAMGVGLGAVSHGDAAGGSGLAVDTL
eukprot:323697-Chlamydomonas_euryale.AAC.4